MRRPNILICCDHFLPGYEAGGPIATLGNLTANLGDEFNFKIITRDRDINDSTPYPEITPGVWAKRFGAEVFYLQPGRRSPSVLVRQLKDVDYDALYINSFFSPLFSTLPLLARRLGKIPHRPVIVAPRGELAGGALALKWHKKRAFLQAARILSMHRDVLWQAASLHERDDIRQHMGVDTNIALASNLARGVSPETTGEPCHKDHGEIRLLFLGRVSAVKNTAEALRILSHEFQGKIAFDIAGPKEDKAYWNECEELARTLPKNVAARFLGAVPAETIPELINRYHLLFSPTTGENFGHAILEAMMCGCPVLISDRTPWRNLQPTHAGWDYPLEARDQFRLAIQTVLDMDQGSFSKLRMGARTYAQRHFSRNEVMDQNRQLFHQALRWPASSRLAA